ncbi:tyrosine-type recombinase/integrase [Massilia sp. P8910]|uniref:phage integrase n=1 Tax=Massilia antarctica TaxID=2765360 RepID=UPI001E3D0225|nr:tyrosine-type recombinase/integrase [Massilia antarctica]MCE3602698.1 tyrosine-type recombinase/integrase [Massilia antarctica]
MSVKKHGDEWLADVRPNGAHGKRYRKTFATKREALEYEAWLKTNAAQTPDWQPKKRDVRRLASLIDIWYTQHGTHLSSGEDTYSRLKNLCTALGNPFADKLNGEVFAEYRATRMAAGLSASNMNREKSYLLAMFNELKRLDVWKGENPLEKVRSLKIAERELAYLSLDQVGILLGELKKAKNEHVYLISEVCLATGARWSEAEGLRKPQVRDGLIQFAMTKSKKVRAVPIDKQLEADLAAHYKSKSETIGDERFFTYAYSAFISALERSGIVLPAGQAAHVMRHTFASHFMINGGNILALQKILGHSSLAMTMRYAHLSPDHLIEARKLNPLSCWKKIGQKVDKKPGSKKTKRAST